MGIAVVVVVAVEGVSRSVLTDVVVDCVGIRSILCRFVRTVDSGWLKSALRRVGHRLEMENEKISNCPCILIEENEKLRM